MRRPRLREAVRIVVLIVLLILADVALALIAIELFQAIAWWEAAEGPAGCEGLGATALA